MSRRGAWLQLGPGLLRRPAALLRTALLVLLSTLWAGPAAAQSAKDIEKARKLPRRQAKLVNHRGWLALSVGWRDVVDSKIRRKLLSGLPTIIATRVYVFPDQGQQPIGLSVQTCRIVYDLWDEIFRIEIHQGGKRRETVAVNVEGVLRRCGGARRLPLVSTQLLKPTGGYFAGVLVEVNPLSKKMLERIKRWVALPHGAGTVSPGDSLFGSFVGLFVTHIPAADKVATFRTQSFKLADLPRTKAEK